MSKTLCVLPWMHLATHPSGGTSLCCRSNHTNAVSWAKQPNSPLMMTLENFKLKDMVNCDTNIRVRQAMIDGQQPIECEGCWRDEDAGIKSKRQYENERWAHIIDELEKSAFIKRPNYRYIELRLGNICNNACLTCNSYSSSRWYPDEKKISKDLPWFNLRPLENFKWFENPEFYDALTLYSEGVEEIYINGGEPTLIKAHFRYLENLINNGTASKVHLVYSLNMMDIPDNLIELWKSFKQVTVNASIDDYAERNYYIRYPTKWEETLASIDKLNDVPNVYWHVTQTVSIFNVFNLDELSDWLYTNYEKRPYHNYVLYPDYLSFAVIPEHIKDELRNMYGNSLPEEQRNDLLAKLNIDFDPELLEKAKQFINSIDKVRNLSYNDYLPEISKFI